MAKKFTNVETYLGILFLFALLTTGIAILGNELIENDNANLDNDSILYIAQLNGIDTSEFNVTRDQLENPISFSGNETQGNPKDFGLEYLYAKEKASPIEIVIKAVHTLPQNILVDMLRFDFNDFEWLIIIFNWLYTLLIAIAIIFFIRGIIRS